MDQSKTSPYHLTLPSGALAPIVVSCPHSGRELPVDLRPALVAKAASELPDTDFFVDELYGFAPPLGVTLIHARFSRFLIDLNRDPNGKKLYADGRQETALVPVRDFSGNALYEGQEPDAQEIQRRVESYYRPYHQKVEDTLTALRRLYPRVLLLEAHSIKRSVPTLSAKPFPDLILGDQRGRTADSDLTATALATLRQSPFDVAHNEPFMGGFLTRKFGRPESGINAIQLEMSQDIYMNEAARARSPEQQSKLVPWLERLVLSLLETLRAPR